MVINVANNGGDNSDLAIGLAEGATAGLDPELETELPPKPPSQVFDARLAIAGKNGSATSIQDLAAATPGNRISWGIKFQPGSGGYPVTLRWDPAALPANGKFTLQDVYSGVLGINLDMSTAIQCEISDEDIYSVKVLYEYVPPVVPPAEREYAVTLNRGWSMVSLPVQVADRHLETLFADALSAFGWTGLQYEQVDGLEACVGYWVNLGTGGTYTMRGVPNASCQGEYPRGWNLIGAPYDALQVAAIGQTPSGIILSVFRWTGQLYEQVNAVARGWGYWVHLHQAGSLSLQPGGAEKRVAVTLPPVSATGWLYADDGRARIELALGVPADQVVELPPPAPARSMDVRVLVDGRPSWRVPAGEGLAEFPLQVQGDGITFTWQMPVASGAAGWELELDGVAYPLVGSGSLRLAAAPVRAALVRSPAVARPAEFALLPSYPNPFNPATSIAFTLAESGWTSLRLYDMAGQAVRTLVDEPLEIGLHRLTWDGRDDAGRAVAAGVYIVDLRSNGLRAVHKVALLK